MEGLMSVTEIKRLDDGNVYIELDTKYSFFLVIFNVKVQCLLLFFDYIDTSSSLFLTSLFYIPIRFILLNRIASLGHCLCSSSSSVISLCLSLSSCSSELSTSISIVNLLTSPLSDSTSYVNENHRNDQSISDEICPPL
ncbi:unnamed protein product [Rotaria socialis]